MNSYARSMVSQRWARSSRGVTDTGRISSTPCLRASVAWLTDNPALGIVMLQVLAARDPAEDHRLGDPPFVRTDGEVNVGDHQTDQRHACHAVRYVDESPGRIRQ